MTKYELILCIVNTGFSDTVMEAAKDKGARGGTVFHARGTANKEAEEFFHITIQPDKEVVMILVPNTIKDDVLHAVYQAAGLKTAGQGIAFAVPVNDVVGISSPTDAAVAEQKTKADKPESDESNESNESNEQADEAEPDGSNE